MTQSLSLKARLAITSVILSMLAFAIVGFVQTSLLRSRLTSRLEHTLNDRLVGLEHFLRKEAAEPDRETILDETLEYLSTQSEAGLIEVTQLQDVIHQQSALPAHTISQDHSFELFGQQFHARGAASLEPVDQAVHELAEIWLISLPFLIMLIGGGAYWNSSRALSPVDSMTKLARAIGIRNLDMRLEVPTTNDEIQRLAQGWNEMLERLESSVSNIQNFTSDAAHELRTPLTALRTSAEVALRRPRTSEEYTETLSQMVTVTERMARLVESLLELARGDRQIVSSTTKSVDIAHSIRTVAHRFAPLVSQKNQVLELALPKDPLLVGCDDGELDRVICVILENALRYTPEAGTIRITVDTGDTDITMNIDDSGPGIDEASLPHLFERFYRADRSRSSETGGFGLGLAIAKQIVTAHRGWIEVRNLSTQGFTGGSTGARFSVHFPKTRAQV